MRKLTHQELLRRQKENRDDHRLPFVAVLNNIRSLHNVGSIFRTCDGVGAEKLWLCGITGYPPSGQLAKTALGAEGCVPWEYQADAGVVLKELKTRNYQIVLLEQTTQSIPYQEFRPAGPVCLVVGNEIEGVTPPLVAMCDAAIEIEMAGMKNSLNAAVAFGIAAYHIRLALMKNIAAVFCLLFVLCACVFPAAADEAPLTAGVQSRYAASSDIEATNSSIEVTTSQLNVVYQLKAFGELPVDLSLDVGHTDINEDDPLDLPSHLESRRFGLSTKFPAPFISDDRFFMGLDVFPTLNTDAWDWRSGAFRAPLRGYLIFKENDDFILVGGVSVRPDYEDKILPVIGLIYKPNDRWSFNFASDDPNISYKLNDATLLRWEINYVREEYEVTRGAQEGVVLQYREVSSGFGIEHKFTESFNGLVSVGGVFDRQFKYRDGEGKAAPESGGYVRARLSAIF
ncbi:MAG: RNA methyltransferase [Candidatus Omnitrophica bacterium]|nr:RNA methyltransferase [Candidatus Omnitrophota bacterium]